MIRVAGQIFWTAALLLVTNFILLKLYIWHYVCVLPSKNNIHQSDMSDCFLVVWKKDSWQPISKKLYHQLWSWMIKWFQGISKSKPMNGHHLHLLESDWLKVTQFSSLKNGRNDQQMSKLMIFHQHLKFCQFISLGIEDNMMA